MLKALQTVSLTLLIGLVAVVLAAFAGRYVPGLFDPGIKEIVVAGWVAALVSWFVARMVMSKEQESRQESSGSGGGGMLVAMLFLSVAIGIGVMLHLYGDRFLPWNPLAGH